MSHDYWSRVLSGRTSRRRAIAATGASAFGAALLVACGGGNDTESKRKNTLVTEAEDTFKEAKRGGTIKDRNTADPSTQDVHQPIAPLNFSARHAYSTLVVEKPGYLGPEKFELGPDLAESWESSPDGLEITLKLRQGVKWHNKAPVSGRPFEADDVVASWKRYAAQAPLRGLVANSAS